MTDPFMDLIMSGNERQTAQRHAWLVSLVAVASLLQIKGVSSPLELAERLELAHGGSPEDWQTTLLADHIKLAVGVLRALDGPERSQGPRLVWPPETPE